MNPTYNKKGNVLEITSSVTASFSAKELISLRQSIINEIGILTDKLSRTDELIAKATELGISEEAADIAIPADEEIIKHK